VDMTTVSRQILKNPGKSGKIREIKINNFAWKKTIDFNNCKRHVLCLFGHDHDKLDKSRKIRENPEYKKILFCLEENSPKSQNYFFGYPPAKIERNPENCREIRKIAEKSGKRPRNPDSIE
jgi:hypothetical protein